MTGTIHHVWNGLTYDLTTVAATMGTYPSFAFTPDDGGVIIWAAGKLWHVPLNKNAQDERIASENPPTPILFHAHIELRLAETRLGTTDIVKMERKETDRVRALVDLAVNQDGSKAVFQAAGRTYAYDVLSRTVQPIPTLDDAPHFSPFLIPGTEDLVIQARWSDTNFTTFELANITSRRVYEVIGLPTGRYISPTLCSGVGRKRRTIAFLKSGGTRWTGNVVATANPGLWIGELELPAPSEWEQLTLRSITIFNVQFIAPIEIGYWSPTTLRFLDDNTKLLVQHTSEATIIDLASGPDKFGDYQSETIVRSKAATELVAVPSPSKPTAVAFVDYFHVYFALSVAHGEVVWSKPGRATSGLARLSTEGGHHVTFSGDGTRLFWFSGKTPWNLVSLGTPTYLLVDTGPVLHSVELSELGQCKHEIEQDKLYFGTNCTRRLVKKYDIVVEYDTDFGRLKKETAQLERYSKSAHANADVVAYYNATILTMESGSEHGDVIHNAVLITRAGLVESTAGAEDADIPTGATIIDAEGGESIRFSCSSVS